MSKKTCAGCGAEKDSSEFYFNKVYGNRYYQCKPCTLKMAQATRRTLRDKAIEILGGRCAHCGVTDSRILCFDHRLGLRGKKRESNDMVFRLVIAGSNDFQLLCHNCNHLKRFDNNEFAGKVR